MRKITAIAVVLALLVGIMSPAWAAESSAKISQEKALQIAKEAFGIPDNLKNVQIGYREEDYYANKKVWEFNWDLSRYSGYHHIRAEIDADTGEVISYSENEEYKKNKKPAQLKSEAECKVLAEGLINKLAPQKLKEVKQKDLPYLKYEFYYGGPKTYSFMYEREIDGIPFPENNIRVSVNAENGKVREYWTMWDNTIKFPTVAGAIYAEQAEKIFREDIGLKLAYLRPSGPYPPSPVASKKPVELYYSIWDSYGLPGVIDAFTGKIIDNSGKELKIQKKADLPVKEEPVIQESDKALTLEEAKAKVGSYINVPSNYILQSSRYSEGWRGRSWKTWEFQYAPKDYRDGEPFNVNINAVTGELMSYNRWGGPWEEGKEHTVKYDYEKCKQMASDFLKKVAPHKNDYVYLYEYPQQQYNYSHNGKAMTPPSYGFNFTRIVNGLPYTMNSINIDVNNGTGEVRGFWMNWDPDVKFAPREGLITEEEALNALFKEYKPRITYIRKNSDEGRPSSEVMLVYAMSYELPKIIEAKTGKISNSYELENPVEFDDVQGHWAEREIRVLASWGVVSGSNNKFNPDKAITRAEFVNMLVLAKGMDTDNPVSQTFTDVPKAAWYYKAVEAGAKAGLIKGSQGKFEPDKVITRQEMAVILINALNNGEEGSISEEFPAEFKDKGQIAGWAKNAVIQAIEMGILTGTDGYLKPATPATRAEAVVMLLRVIERSNEYGGFSGYATKWIG